MSHCKLLMFYELLFPSDFDSLYLQRDDLNLDSQGSNSFARWRLVPSNFDRQWSKRVARDVVEWMGMGLQSMLWETRHYLRFGFWVCRPTCHTIRFDRLGRIMCTSIQYFFLVFATVVATPV